MLLARITSCLSPMYLAMMSFMMTGLMASVLSRSLWMEPSLKLIKVVAYSALASAQQRGGTC